MQMMVKLGGTQLTLLTLQVSDASHVSTACMCTCLHTGLVVEHLISAIYIVNANRLPIVLKCNVTGVVVAWRVNNKYYSLTDLTNGVLPGHSRNGTNMLLYRPKNYTEYVCVSTTSDGDVSSDPAYIFIFGE